MNAIIQNRHFYTSTETSNEFVDPMVRDCPVRPKESDTICEAPLLIHGKLRNFLHLSWCPSSQTPATCYSPPHERYATYVNKINDCFPRHLIVGTSRNAEQQIANALHDQTVRSTYHNSYCRREDGLYTQKRQERDSIEAAANREDTGEPSTISVDTTYRESYTSPEEFKQFYVPAQSYRPVLDKDAALKRELQKIFRFERSTYRAEISDVWFLKNTNQSSYLDRYTKI